MQFKRYADPQTPYMYHCHIMEHEDRGMMGQFLVTEPPAELAATTGKPTVVVFIAGFGCEHCYEQVQLFDNTLAAARINLLIVTPEAEPEQRLVETVQATVVADPQKQWSGWLGVLHEGPAHGTYLLDANGQVAWSTDEETPYMDVKALIQRVKRLGNSAKAEQGI